MRLIPIHVMFFTSTHSHYARVAAQLSLKGWTSPGRRRNTVVVPIGGLHRSVIEALEYAKTLSPDVRAIYVNIEAGATEQVKREWDQWGHGVRLVVLDSPDRSLVEPLLDYIDRFIAGHPGDYITIILPEFVPATWWYHLFHNQRALLIKGALLFKPNTVVTSVPFHLRH